MDPLPHDAVPPGSVVVFYDGVCGFCDRALRFVARRDRGDSFRFAPLQSAFAREVLLAHDVDPSALDTMYTLVDYGLSGERVYARASAVLRALSELGGLWRALSVLGLLPPPILDWAYDRFASRRYSIFGKFDECPIPAASLRKKFVDLPDTAKRNNDARSS